MVRHQKISLWLTTLALAALLALPTVAVADSHEEDHPKYLMVHTDQVEPSRIPDYEAGMKKWVAAFQEASMGPEWTWYTSSSGLDYTWVTPLPNMAALDNQEAREKEMTEAIGEEKMAELMKSIDTVRSHHSQLAKMRPDLSYQPEGAEEAMPGFMTVGIYTIKPAMTKQFEDLVQRVAAARAKTEQPLAVEGYEMAFGEGSYVFVTMAKDAGTLYGAPQISAMLAEAYGPEETQKMYGEYLDCVVEEKHHNAMLRPDLSFVPQMAAMAGE